MKPSRLQEPAMPGSLDDSVRPSADEQRRLGQTIDAALRERSEGGVGSELDSVSSLVQRATAPRN